MNQGPLSTNNPVSPHQVWKKKTFRAFMQLLDNYEASTHVEDRLDRSEMRESYVFMETAMKEPVMQYVHKVSFDAVAGSHPALQCCCIFYCLNCRTSENPAMASPIVGVSCLTCMPSSARIFF